MENLDPQILGILSVMSGVGFAMVWLAGRLHMLEQRHSPRRCPSCGLVVRPGAHCRCAD